MTTNFNLSGNLIPVIMYIADVAVLTMYFMKLFSENEYSGRKYFAVLGRHSIKWIPLIFIVLPVSMSILGFNKEGYITAILYYSGMFIVYYPKNSSDSRGIMPHMKRNIIFYTVIWLIMLGGSLAAPGSLRTALLIAACCNYLMIPCTVVLTDIMNKPFVHLMEDKRFRLALREIEDRQKRSLKVIGITGSYGKSEMRNMLCSLLKGSYKVLSNDDNTKSAGDIAELILENKDTEYDFLVVEMDAVKAGDVRKICSFVRPNIGIVTTIGYRHLDTLINIPGIVKAVYELTDYVGEFCDVKGHGSREKQLSGTNCYLNGDCEFIRENDKYRHPVKYGLDPDNGCCGTIRKVTQEGTFFTVSNVNGSVQNFHTGLIGKYSIVNLIGAIAVADSLGIPMKDMVGTVHSIKGTPRRLELLRKGECVIIDDTANTSPDGVRAAMTTMGLFEGKRIVVTSGVSEPVLLRVQANRRLGAAAAAAADELILIGGYAREIRAGALEEGFIPERILIFDKAEDAMERLNVAVHDGSVILFEGGVMGIEPELLGET